MSDAGVELDVYAYDDITNFLGTIHSRQEPTFLRQLKATGGGSCKLNINASELVNNAKLIDYRNIVKVKVDSKVIGAFQLGGRDSTTIASGERADEAYQIVGEGLKILFDDATVKPVGGLHQLSGSDRYFSFASERGEWYKTADWINPTIYGAWKTVSGWGDAPTDWPTISAAAQWIGSEAYSTNALTTPSYYRLEFTIAPGDDGNYAVYAGADNFLNIWLDGEQIYKSKREDLTADWMKAVKASFTLAAGDHVLAFSSENAVHVGSNPTGLIVTLNKVDGTAESMVARSGAGNWKVLPHPSVVPGWTSGEILLKLLDEAEARGVLFPAWFTPTFTAALDSNGQPWMDRIDWSFKVGESYSSVVKKMEELLCDIWIDAETMTLNMVPQRGVDRSIFVYDVDGITPLRTPVKFERGKNLTKATSTGKGKMKNALDVKTAEGWLTSDNEYDPSTLKYGRLEAILDTGASPELSKSLAQIVFAQKGLAEEGASYEVLTAPGYIPLVDFAEGDWVLAPNEQNEPVKRRIMSISVKENGETGEPEYTIEFDTIFQDNESRLTNFMNKSGGGSLGGSFSNATGGTDTGIGDPIVTPPSGPPTPTPKAPTGLSASSVGTWSPNGVTAQSELTLSWTPVVANTDDTLVTPLGYEVWGYPTATGTSGLTMFANVAGTTAKITPFQPGTNWTFYVVAIGVGGRQSAKSATQTHTMLGPNTPMAAPTTPVLTSSSGILFVNWDGLLVPSLTPPLQFRYVYPVVSTTSGGTYARAGTAMTRDSRSSPISGLTIGSTYWVKLIAVDGAGVESVASAAASLAVTGVDLGDLDSDVTNAIAAADQAALDALSSTNILGDPSFELNTEEYWDWNVTGVTNVTTAPHSGARNIRAVGKAGVAEVLRYIPVLPCDPADSFFLKISVRAAVAAQFQNAAIQLRVLSGVTAASLTTDTLVAESPDLTTAYVDMGGNWVAPAGHYFWKPLIKIVDTGTTNVYYIDDIRALRMVGPATIIDGAVIAGKIAAGAVTAGTVAANAIAAANIQAGAIVAGKIATDAVTANEILAGTITGNEIAAGTLTASHLQAGVGGALDISANSSITLVVGQVNDVQSDVDETRGNLEEMQTFYDFGPTGAVISTPSSPFAVGIRNDKIEMLENGNVVSYWNSGVMYVNQLVGEKVVLGNHQLERYSDGTVVRAL